MFYFIPAWQNSQVTKTDDMLSQIKMFQSVEEPMQVYVRDYFPNLRTFLFFEGMTEVPHISIYDEMQNIRQEYENKIDVYDINWPSDVSFYYSQFAIYVMQADRHYASVFFDALNNIERIEFYDELHRVIQKFFIDDRGFISLIENFEDNKLVKKEYYNESFELQFSIDYTKEQIVTLGVENQKKYNRATFDTLAEFAQCVLQAHLNELTPNDTIVFAIDNHLLRLFGEMNSITAKCVASIFSHRTFDYRSDLAMKYLSQMDLILTDNPASQKNIQSLQLSVPIEVITPYDAVLKLGESQRVGYYLIHFVYHGLPLEQVNALLYQIIHWNHQYRWHFAIDCIKNEDMPVLQEKLKSALATYYQVDSSIVEECYNQMNQNQENELVDEEVNPDLNKTILRIKKVIKEITVVYFSDKEELLSGLIYTRILIDLANQPDVLRQICGISIGIPMINVVDTGYVINHQNGRIIEDESTLESVLLYYLTGLRHWNESLVYSVAQLNRYTNGAIVNQWKEWLEIGED